MNFNSKKLTSPKQRLGTRLMVFLPVHGRAQRKAHDAVLRFLTDVVTDDQGKRPRRVSGLTQSLPKPASFLGCWWSDKQQDWDQEKVSIIIIDHDSGPEEPQFSQFLNELALEVHRCYQHYDCQQQEVLIAAHPVSGYSYKHQPLHTG